MNDSIFEQIREDSKYINLELSVAEMGNLAMQKNFDESQMNAIADVFSYMKERKRETIVSTILRMSRLPQKQPKTFENFDFSKIYGKQADDLKSLSSLAALYGRRNLVFIGPPGVGKTHLAMAFGHACCQKGMKTYFLSAQELNQRFSDARKYGREGSTINGLVKPSCLIIDEVGRCVFDPENTRMFFDVIDRRYNKDVPNTIIFTSNSSPDKWSRFFSDDPTLLCAMDRVFDTATVYMIKGNSYRGKNCETISLTAGASPALPKLN